MYHISLKFFYSDQAEWSYCWSWDIYVSYKNEDTQRACEHNTAACSCEHCCVGKCYILWVCVLVALVTQGSTRMRLIVICGLSGCPNYTINTKERVFNHCSNHTDHYRWQALCNMHKRQLHFIPICFWTGILQLMITNKGR